MKFTNEQLDKIKGVFFGQAIGDALGLGTEFMTKSEVKLHYPNGLTNYEQIIQDNHRSRWKKGSWTDDTDLFLCIVDTLLESKSCDELLIAKNFKRWFNGTPLGIGSNMYKVLSYPQYASNPTKAAEMIWKLSNRNNASNGAIMRTSILGVFDCYDSKKVIQNAEKVARITHFDPRCVSSSVIVSLVIAQLIQNNELPTIDQLKQLGNNYHPEIATYLDLATYAYIDTLDLDNANSLGFTLKAMAAGLWTLFHCSSFEEGLQMIIHEGGDADTNGCVAGSLLGAKFGFQAIPEHLVEGLLHRELLEKKFWEFVGMMEKDFNFQ